MPLASSRDSSNTADVVDVITVMLAFERMNNCRLEVRLSRVEKGHTSDLQLTMLAHPPEGEIGEVVPLVSANVTCLAMNLKTLDSAVLAALYRLDFQLAQQEFTSADPK